MATTSSSYCRGPRFDPFSGDLIRHATTKSLPAVTKDLKCPKLKQLIRDQTKSFCVCFPSTSRGPGVKVLDNC